MPNQGWNCNGNNASYAHGCRCNDCGRARMERQRKKRGTKKPRASKYTEPEVPADSLAIWKERFGAR